MHPSFKKFSLLGIGLMSLSLLTIGAIPAFAQANNSNTFANTICTKYSLRIDKLETKITAARDLHTKKLQVILTKLNARADVLKLKGANVSDLKNNLTTLGSFIPAFNQSYTDLLTKLTADKVAVCGGASYKGLIKTNLVYFKSQRQQSLANFVTYFKTTIKPEFLALKSQLTPK